MSSLRLRVVALLVSLATVLPSTAFARVHYFCRMMDRVMDSPCCESERAAARLPPREDIVVHEEARAPDCCLRVEASRTGVAPGPRYSLPVVISAALVATLSRSVFTLPPASTVDAHFEDARGPPPLGPPLFLAHCSLLI
jgi:hypothetical protein